MKCKKSNLIIPLILLLKFSFAQGPLIGSELKVYKPFDTLYVDGSRINEFTLHTYPHNAERINDSTFIQFTHIPSSINVLHTYTSSIQNSTTLINEKAVIVLSPSGSPCFAHELKLKTWYKSDFNFTEIPIRIVFPKYYGSHVTITKKDSGQVYFDANINYFKCSLSDTINNQLIKWEICKSTNGIFDENNVITLLGEKAFYWFTENGTYIVRNSVNLLPAFRENYDTISVGNAASPATGISNTDNIVEISVYPNPIENQITIRSKTNNSSVQIIDATGKTVYIESFDPSVPVFTIEVAELQKGVYILQTTSESGLIHRKKVVK